VHVVVNVANLGEYSETLREQLVEPGLREDTREGASVCRWLLDDLIVDIMPTRGEILGLSSAWYPLACATATPITLPDGTTIAELLEALLALPDAEDVIAAQLLPDAKSQDRLPFVLDRIGQLIAAGRS
jgi:hypothetical protein